MKNLIYKFSFLALILTTMVSCEDEIIIFDNPNDESVATFQSNSPSPIIFNPAEDTRNVYTISVSSVSAQDRTVNLSIDPSSTMDPSFYTIETLNPVIPAGEYSTEVVILTAASDVFPAGGSTLKINIDSVDGAELKDYSITSYTLPFTVQCPTVDIASIPGTYKIIEDEFDTTVGDDTFEIVAGPGENQFTMVNPFDHPNPAADGEQNYEVVVSINPSSGTLTVARQNAWHYSNYAASPAYGVGRINGSGLALTCIGQMTFSLVHTVAAGSFGTYGLTIRKQ